MTSLSSQFARGAAWMVGMRAVVNLLGIVSTIVLARLLTPTDFGVVALAGSAYAFFSMLGQFGFDTALIQHRSPSREHYDTAWTANILVGVFVSIMMFIVAKPATAFFEDERLEHVILAFSILSLAKGLENIGVVNFRKYLQFRGDFLYFVLPKITSVPVAIIAAYFMRNYWALVIGMITSQVATLFYSHLSQSFRPRLSLVKFRELFQYSRWILMSSGLLYLSNHGREILLGKLLDTASVGLYGIAKQIAFLPSEELLAPINRALFPSLASVSDSPDRLRNAVLRVISVTALLAIPASAGIAVLAPLIVSVLLGDEWSGAAPVLAVLALVGIFQAVQTVLGPLLLARGKPKIMTLVNAIWLIIVLPAVFLLVPQVGVVGVAYAGLLGPLITLPVLIVASNREVGLRWRSIVKAIWRPVIGALTMAWVVDSTAQLLQPADYSGFLLLTLLVLLGVITYAITMATVWCLAGFPRGGETELWSLAKARMGSRGSSEPPE